MRLIDVNVLVYTFRTDTPDHAAQHAWLETIVNTPEPVGLPASTCSGFLRVVTNPRIFPVPTPLKAAIDFVRILTELPNVMVLLPDPRHLGIFLDLCLRTQATGKLVPDAELAAMALCVGGELITADRDFARFPGLRWRHPLEAQIP